MIIIYYYDKINKPIRSYVLKKICLLIVFIGIVYTKMHESLIIIIFCVRLSKIQSSSIKLVEVVEPSLTVDLRCVCSLMRALKFNNFVT